MTTEYELFFDRYRVQRRPDELQLLCSLTTAYSNLPYENVTKILKDARSSSSQEKLRHTSEVLQDHLRWNTGGTCFSLCNALQELLTYCGFDGFIAMADMYYGPNIHCAVISKVGGQHYLIDPGYLLHQPIPLPNDSVSIRTSMNTIHLKNEGNATYSLFTEEHGIRKWRYRLRDQSISRAEFEKYWIHSFSLNSMEHIMLTRANDSGRLYYRKDRLELVQHSTRTKQKISSTDAVTLSQMFGLPADLIQAANKTLNR
jgi:arylamine N-acetyltransferase